MGQPPPSLATPRSSPGAPTLTSLLGNGAEVSVAGLGGCGLLLHEAARGWPAPRQALHGPHLHAAAAAGRALREAQATVTLGRWVLGPPPLPRSPTTTRLLPVVPPYDWWWVLDQILDFSQVWTLGRRACKSECSHHQGLGGHEKAAHIWGHRLWSFVECRHQASLSAAPGREMTSQLPPRQSDTEPLPDWSTGTLVPFKSPGGVTGTLPGAFPDMEATAHSSGPIWDPLWTRKWEGTWAIRQTEELKPPNPQQLICPQRK